MNGSHITILIVKKVILGLLVCVVLVFVVAFVVGLTYLGPLIKTSVEAAGPEITKVDVKLEGADVSVLSGKGILKGLIIGNPKGFKSPSAMKIDLASLAVDVRSLLSDKIVVKSVRLEAPEITFETDLNSNNLSKLLENVQASVNAVTGGSGGGSAGGASKESPGKAKKIQVDELVLAGAKVNVSASVLGGKSLSLTLPDIEMKGLGSGGDGITPAELTQKILDAVTKETVSASMEAITKAGKAAAEGLLNSGKDAAKKLGADEVGKAAKGILDTFKGKK